jgi:hypothetical protein
MKKEVDVFFVGVSKARSGDHGWKWSQENLNGTCKNQDVIFLFSKRTTI